MMMSTPRATVCTKIGMKTVFAVVIAIFAMFSGCAVEQTTSIRIKGSAIPPQTSILKATPVEIEMSVENIGNATRFVKVSASGSEGMDIKKVDRDEFTLKPGEIRVVSFIGILKKDALPGKYIVELSAFADGDAAKTTVEVRVVKD